MHFNILCWVDPSNSKYQNISHYIITSIGWDLESNVLLDSDVSPPRSLWPGEEEEEPWPALLPERSSCSSTQVTSHCQQTVPACPCGDCRPMHRVGTFFFKLRAERRQERQTAAVVIIPWWPLESESQLQPLQLSMKFWSAETRFCRSAAAGRPARPRLSLQCLKSGVCCTAAPAVMDGGRTVSETSSQ